MLAKASQRHDSKAQAAQARSSVAIQTKAGPTGHAAMLMSLQRSHGNRFVQRMLEATLLQRDCGCGGMCSACSSKQLQSSSVRSVVDEVLNSPGQPLDVSTRAFMQPRFGRDFGDVRIHTGTKASESAQAVSALAYTVGQDVVFAAGQYNPATQEGRHLLAHELTHTVQQAGASPGRVTGISRPGDASEREAERLAERVMRMPAPTVGGLFIEEATGARVQRKCGQCAGEENDEPRADAVRCPGVEGEEGDLVHREMPPVHSSAEELAEAEEEPLSPVIRTSGIVQRAQARGAVPAGAELATPVADAMAVQPRVGAAGVLQRWSADGPADASLNTIVCDGSGGVRVQLSNANDPTSFACVGDCITPHENSHKADALKANPKVCQGVADGSQLNFGSGEQKPSEIKASQVEIDCLKAKKSPSKACKPHIKARLKQMRKYRDSFK